MAGDRKINILTVYNNPNSFSFVFPILMNKDGLSERRIKTDIFYSADKRLYECDIIFIDNKFFKRWWQNNRDEDIYRFLQNARSRTGAVLWFDTSDSTGTPQFEVLPYVDGYYKNQILKDKRSYFNSYYRTRIFSDYYYKKFGVSDDIVTGRETALDAEYIDKIDISWNPALNDHGIYGNSYSLPGNVASKLRKYMPLPIRYTADFTKVGRTRNIDIAARLGFSHPRRFVTFHRDMLRKTLKRFKIDTTFINHKGYYEELQNAKISISPFGLGEITYRDFESIICGALLIKPDMSHLATWPDIYREGETYIKCNWDFSDLHEKIDGLMADAIKRNEMAMEAQRTYRYYLFGGGRKDFCDRIDEMLGRYIK